MKKIISVLISLILILIMVFPLSVSAEQTPSVFFESDKAVASHTFTVSVKIDFSLNVAASELVFNYGDNLELLKVENGSYFCNGYGSAVSTNGVCRFIGSNNGKNVQLVEGVICLLTFKVKDDCPEGDKINISLDESSRLLTVNEDNTVSGVTFTSTPFETETEAGTECAEGNHDYKKTTVCEASFITGGLSYSVCEQCHKAVIDRKEAKEIGLFTYEGCAIRSQGNPSGIAFKFLIDTDKLEEIENAGYKVEIGYCFGNKEENRVVCYGDGATESLINNAVICKKEGLGSNEKVITYAYVIIYDEILQIQREEIIFAKLNGKDEISIFDIAFKMDLSKYSQETNNYISAVLNGFS